MLIISKSDKKVEYISKIKEVSENNNVPVFIFGGGHMERS